MPRRAISVRSILIVLVLSVVAWPAHAAFVTFESGQVRPLGLSPLGTRLFAVNTPDNRLEVFTVGAGGLTHESSVPVGLEPVAVAARTETEVWVVNHLSDSVSVVDVGAVPPRVTRTLLVGDEPRDVVFAGANRAFITCAHRGQSSPDDPQLTTAGVGRADVWVFDALDLGASLGGTRLAKVVLFGDTPRALAVAPDGSAVYAAVFQSGNRTTALSEGVVCDGGAFAAPCNVFGFTMPGGLPAPNTNFQGSTGPETGLIMKFNASTNHWEDRLGRNWDNGVRFSLPDQDVFKIDAATLLPTAAFTGVGTVLFNMAVNPVSGKVYVSNTDARNEVRFEGPGTFGCATPPCTVRGHLHEARITVLRETTGPPALVVEPRHLNKHIDYTVVPSLPSVKAKSLATPLGMAVTGDGATLYVAAFGSSQIGVFSTAALENDTFVPDAADHIAVSGGGPTGLVLDEAHGRLYALTRFDNAVAVVDTATRLEQAHLGLHNPEPPSVVAGRHVLYDAQLTSSNGEAACGACHVFADFDSLAWDLGNPDDVQLNNPNPFVVGGPAPFHPEKGPMTTQSLRGMANHGPMHWRGDRTGGNDPGGDALAEDQGFKKFIGAFDGLLGRGSAISNADMQAFTDFILQVTYPPNPIRALDNSLNATQQAGRNAYFLPGTDVIESCNGCHTLDGPAGFFGSSGSSSFENEPQLFKVPHLRNAYQKVGMFGMPQVAFFTGGNNGNLGAQVRGFGFLHDGSVDTLFRFHKATVFILSTTQQQQLEQLVLAFDTNLAPIVGQQITLSSTNGATVGPRIDLLIARAAAAANECDVVVKGTIAGEQRGILRISGGQFRRDRVAEPLLTDGQVRALATSGQDLTYTCVPPGSGQRIGLDRDEDGFFDRDELDAGSDPADPASVPGAMTTTTTSTSTTSTTMPLVLIQTQKVGMKDDATLPINTAARRFAFTSSTKREPSANRIVPPPRASADDPTLAGGLLVVYNGAGLTGDVAAVALPPGKWTPIGPALNPKGYRFKDPTGAVTSVIVRADRITVKAGKASWPYTLDEATQGSVATRLVLGTGEWCAEATLPVTDEVGRFKATKSPPPASCPPTPGP